MAKMLCYQFQIIIGIASCLKLLSYQGMFTILLIMLIYNFIINNTINNKIILL